MTLRVGVGAAPFRPEAVEFVRQAERLFIPTRLVSPSTSTSRWPPLHSGRSYWEI